MTETNLLEKFTFRDRVRNNIYSESNFIIDILMDEQETDLINKYQSDLTELEISLEDYYKREDIKKVILEEIKNNVEIRNEVEKFLGVRYITRITEAGIGAATGIGVGVAGLAAAEYSEEVDLSKNKKMLIGFGVIAVCGIAGAVLAVNYMDKIIKINRIEHNAEEYLEAIKHNLEKIVEKEYKVAISNILEAINDKNKEIRENSIQRKGKRPQQISHQSTSYQSDLIEINPNEAKEIFIRAIYEENKENKALKNKTVEYLIKAINYDNYADKVGLLTQFRNTLKDQLKDYICPILFSYPEDPIYASDGHLYSKEELQTYWSTISNLSPQTREPLEDPSKLAVVAPVKTKIKELVDNYKGCKKLIDWMNSNQSILEVNQASISMEL